MEDVQDAGAAHPLPGSPAPVSAPGGMADALFRVAVEAAGEAILVTSPELDEPGPRIEYVNPGFTRMTGYAPGEVIGRNPRLLQGPQTERAVLDRMRDALSQGREFQGEAVNYRKDGSEYVVEWLITPFRNARGEVAHWVSVQRDVTERRRHEDDRKRLLNELNHRVQNTLATVQSIALQTLRTRPLPEEFSSRFGARLIALSRVHQVLTRGHWERAGLLDLVTRQLEAPVTGQRIALSGDEVWIRPGAAIVLGMTLHELADNAARHGALSGDAGRVELSWSVRAGSGGNRLHILWQEAGGPGVSPPRHRGFGLRLIEGGLASELGGDARFRFAPAGVQWVAEIPFTHLA